MAKVRIELIKSPIGYKQDQRDTLAALGLRRIRAFVEKEDNPSLRGMIHKIRHLVKVRIL